MQIRSIGVPSSRKISTCRRPTSAGAPVMRTDGTAGSLKGAGCAPEHTFSLGRHALSIIGYFDDPCLDCRLADTHLDLTDEDVSDAVNAALPERPRHVSPYPCRDHDVDFGGACHISHELDVSPEVRRGQIDDRIYTTRLRFTQLPDSVGAGALPVEEPRVVVVVGTHRHEHVLMAEGETKGCSIDCPEYGLYSRHGSSGRVF